MQTYPADRYEVIVIDNGSTDGTAETVRQFPVTLVHEESMSSPYIARNRGVSIAQGEIFAFIDANCIAQSRWLEEGVSALQVHDADLVGGNVRFTFTANNAAQAFDSITNVDMAGSIATRNVAKGGNLFVRRIVFERIGPFPPVRSGADVSWTGRATRAGFSLVYASSAEVAYPARNLLPLVQKQFRVGRGQPLIWKAEGMSSSSVARKLIGGFRPPALAPLRKRLMSRGTSEMQRQLGSIWSVAWICSIATNLGRICALPAFYSSRQAQGWGADDRS